MNIDEIYSEGQTQYFKKGKYENPYPSGTIEFNEFERGWIQALKRTNGRRISDSILRAEFSGLTLGSESASKERERQSELYRNRKG